MRASGGDMETSDSADELCPIESGSNEPDMYPPKFLLSLNLPKLPNHCLRLKVGAPIMFLRNTNQ